MAQVFRLLEKRLEEFGYGIRWILMRRACSWVQYDPIDQFGVLSSSMRLPQRERGRVAESLWKKIGEFVFGFRPGDRWHSVCEATEMLEEARWAAGEPF